MFTNGIQRHDHTVHDEYLHLKVKADTLQRLFANQALHADELMCEDLSSKKRLCALLLDVLANPH